LIANLSKFHWVRTVSQPRHARKSGTLRSVNIVSQTQKLCVL
jgi:hypothetical protein